MAKEGKYGDHLILDAMANMFYREIIILKPTSGLDTISMIIPQDVPQAQRSLLLGHMVTMLHYESLGILGELTFRLYL
jgi:hypothetical protein